MFDENEDDLRIGIMERLSFLFSDYNCKFVAEMSANGTEYQMQIVASEAVQVKFMLEQASLDMLLAHPDAPRIWSNDVGGIEVWHSFSYLKGLVDQFDPGSAIQLTSSNLGKMPAVTRSLVNKATLLQHYLPHLLPAFSHNPPAGWWAAFEAYKTAWRTRAG